ncbi:MAG: lipid-A-disaccharide synthase [Bacteroidota bacterium]
MRYFIIAGEASGDLHGSNLIRSIKQRDRDAEFNFWGGDLMKAEAQGLLVHYKDVTIMGFVEVLFNLRTIFKNISTCKQQILAFKPDVVVLIDYPGFNLRIAQFCKEQGIKTAYYIAPKIWAWKENRGKKLEKFVDLLLIIFPFEIEYFKKWAINTRYVGNPLVDSIPKGLNTGKSKDDKLIALLPGSRKQEIARILPVMLQVVTGFSAYRFVIAGAPGINPEFYSPYLNEQVEVVFGETYRLLQNSTAAVVCSGTATLETALFNVPQVCGYVANPVSYAIAKKLVKIKYISLVNLCLDKPAITELIQGDFTPDKITEELTRVLPGGVDHNKLMADYSDLRQLLEQEGASDKAAKEIIGLVEG